MEKPKPYAISKWLVYNAYERVKANHGAAGVDGESLRMFEEDLKNNLYKIWNRMSSGSYFPPPVKAVEIPKKSGGVRILGVPTVADRIAQMVVKLTFEPLVEPIFHPDSYGYRPGRSAHDALAQTRQRCWRYDWVLEFDIKGLFDNIPHDLLMKAVHKHTDNPWVLLYIERWLGAPEIQAAETPSPARGTVAPEYRAAGPAAFCTLAEKGTNGEVGEPDESRGSCPVLGELRLESSRNTAACNGGPDKA